jgi:hypothetical protein
MMFHFRLDQKTPAHIRFTVFANGANCGQLCMTGDEAHAFLEMIESAARPGYFRISGDWT